MSHRDQSINQIWVAGIRQLPVVRPSFRQRSPTIVTGLHNRRGLRLLGGDRVDAAQRSGMPLCVMFLDLDGLKAINDALGHGAGDQALVEVADALRSSVRSDDIVGRVGGDEFAMVLAGTSRAEAELLARRLPSLPHNPSTVGPPRPSRSASASRRSAMRAPRRSTT